MRRAGTDNCEAARFGVGLPSWSSSSLASSVSDDAFLRLVDRVVDDDVRTTLVSLSPPLAAAAEEDAADFAFDGCDAAAVDRLLDDAGDGDRFAMNAADTRGTRAGAAATAFCAPAIAA